MKFKTNVTITFNSTNQTILKAWSQACQEIIGNEYEPTCTSGLEGTHSYDSGHYYGRSLDFSLIDISGANHRKLQQRAQEILGENFLVLIESNHFHIQRQKDSF